MFAYCPHCTKFWTNTEFVESYLVNYSKIAGLTKYPDTAKRLKAMAVEHQSRTPAGELNPCVVDGGYNHHCHTKKSCFPKAAVVRKGSKQKNSGRKRKRKDDAECRYRVPAAKKAKTCIQNASETALNWYMWDGSYQKRYIKEVVIERHAYDAFQNVSCPAISQSKFTCNTNISFLMPGPVGQYSFKYGLKDTQKDDTAEYEGVMTASKRTLTGLRKYDSDRSEGVRRLLSASFAHQKTNIVGPSMASYLTRNESRFIMSHSFVWCPLRDMKNLLSGGCVSATVSKHGDYHFFQCAALHYLCRPSALEMCSAFEFYSKYEVVRKTKKTEDQLLPFQNGKFTHPSYRNKSNSFLQGVRERNIRHLIKVFQYDFPDTAAFGGSLMNDSTPITLAMETYCELALLLFIPFREKADLLIDGSFTKRFRQACEEGEVGQENQTFLQNLQDAKSNSFRSSRVDDELQRKTSCYRPADFAHDAGNESEEEEEPDVSQEELEKVLDIIENGVDDCIGSEQCQMRDGIPYQHSFKKLKQKGSRQCGFEHIADMQTKRKPSKPFIQTRSNPSLTDPQNSYENASNRTSKVRPSKNEVVAILLTRTSQRRKTFEEITGSKQKVKVLEANGSVKSILDWGKKAGLDKDQKRAFEIFAASFVLTYYRDAKEDPCDRNYRHTYLKELRQLEKLSDASRRSSNQLICFLHGPGGSGKSTIINLLKAYAKEYCDSIDQPFTKATIVVSAMSGVAATLIQGETVHRAAYLNKDAEKLDQEEIDTWEPTRLLIIDEISFASKEDFSNFHQHLRQLKEQLFLKYGGLDVIFAGDMRQLEPVGKYKKAVYKENCPEFKDWVNCYIELNGMHRFKDDPAWGELLRRFRDGKATRDDINEINKRLVEEPNTLPDDIRYACYQNRDRDSINVALFEQRCKKQHELTGSISDSVMIFSDNVMVKNGNGKYEPLKNCNVLWEDCGEDDIVLPRGKGRMDPVLRLYFNCRNMLTTNECVAEGQANGTQALLKSIVLKFGEETCPVDIGNGITIPGVRASQVDYLVLKHTSKDIIPRTFSVKPKQYTFKAKILKPVSMGTKKEERMLMQMKAVQLPIIVNNATTGHKLQGSGVDQLFVHDWSYTTNWVYVMLSRVKTKKGLFIRRKLSTNLNKYAVPESLKKMIEDFKKRQPNYWTPEEYESYFR